MSWSKNPLLYPRLFHDLLFAVEEGRARITLRVPPGKESKYKFQFYAFKEAWHQKALLAKKAGNFDLAAQDEARSAKLGTYIPVCEKGSGVITYMSKEIVLMEEGVTMELSEEIIPNDAYMLIDALTKSEAELEKGARAPKGKKPSALLPPPQRATSPFGTVDGSKPIPPEDIALKLFGVDTSQHRDDLSDEIVISQTGDNDEEAKS